MRLLFLDTETTGIPKNRNSNGLEKKDNWPDIVSVAWVICDNGNFQHTKYFVIKPDGWDIPQESINIHKITYDYATQNGRDLEEVMAELSKDLASCDTFIAHNVEFDKNVIFNAYKWRLNTNPWPFWPKGEFCTMNASENELKIPSKYPKPTRMYKSPNMAELYTATFHKDPPGDLHNSKRDIETLCEIYAARWL